MRRVGLALSVFVAFAAPAGAADIRPLITAAARTVVVPAYAQLVTAAERQWQGWSAFCLKPSDARLQDLRARYRELADAWSGIEFVKYGPILDDTRFERMAHWPERANAVNRALTALLAKSGLDGLAPAALAGSSAAGQGLTALERLLFDPASPEAVASRLTAAPPQAARRCAVGTAIAGNIARIAQETLEGWRVPGGALDVLGKADEAELREAATRLATELLSFLEFVADHKIGGPLGKGGADEARPTLAEGWRSERSLPAIAINLDAVDALVRTLVDPGTDEGSSVLAALATARRLAHDAAGPIGAMVADPDRRPDLVLLRNAIGGARELAGPALTTALGVTIGFNSRDGD